jgi:peptidase E
MPAPDCHPPGYAAIAIADFAPAPHKHVHKLQDVQSARETADETVSRLEAELDTAEAARDAATVKLQVQPND